MILMARVPNCGAQKTLNTHPEFKQRPYLSLLDRSTSQWVFGMFLGSRIKNGVFAQCSPALAQGCVEGTRVRFPWYAAVSWLLT